MAIEVEQSIPICLILSAIGGSIEVLATALLAYQDAQERQAGQKWSTIKSRLALVANVTLQVISSVIGNLFATWFGPVSIVGPVFLVAQLVANMAVFGSFLGLESFTKDMKVGTYVVVTAAVMLPVVGPGAQHGQDAMALLTTWWAMTWSALNICCMTASCALLVMLDIMKLREGRRVALLLAARASSFTVNLTVSRLFVVSPTIPVLIAALVLKVSSGAINTHALVVQATAVEQAFFVPLNASALILVNAMTGLIVWEDWRVIGSWVGYICVFVQLVLGNYLLLGDVEALSSENTKYGAAKSVKFVLKRKRTQSAEMAGGENAAVGSGFGEMCANQNEGLSVSDENYVKFDDDKFNDDDQGSKQQNASDEGEEPRPPSSLSREPKRRARRKQAWSVVYGLDHPQDRGGAFRRRSIFARDDLAAEELASLRQIV